MFNQNMLRRSLLISGALVVGSTLSAHELLLTELLSNQESAGGEDFWELTNVGTAAVDLSGWSWDDDSQTAGVVEIPQGTQIAPGESVIFTSADASVFRTWWGLDASVQVIVDPDAPGLGGGDGIALFDDEDQLVLFFSYDVDGFTLSDGSSALGDHAGLSAGGLSKTQSLVIDPRYGIYSPRYTYADGLTLGTRASTIDAGDLASPGIVSEQTFADVLILTELLSNQEYASGEDFWELTNVGLLPIDLGAWSWDDNSETAGVVPIPAGTFIQSGESIIFTAADASVFRNWWGIAESVQILSDASAPGFGKNDGVALFDDADNQIFFFSYEAGGFTLSDGSGSAGEHAGPSAGGTLDSQSLVIDPAFGSESPRYTFATTESALHASDFGSPGRSGLLDAGSSGPAFDLSVVVSPSTFAESAANPAAVGTVTRSGDTTTDLLVELTSSDAGEASVPVAVTILAGHASADFDVTAVDDSFPDGSQSVTVTAIASDANSGTADLVVEDDGDVLSINVLLTEVLTSESDGAPSGAEDYWELTNFGDSTVDLSGYSWHDSGRSAVSAEAWALPEGSQIAAGESVIFTESDPAVFRAWWGLDASVQVFQSLGAPGLGKGDGVSFFDDAGNEIFFFSYAGGGFELEDGSEMSLASEHAGVAGGGDATVALVWVPSSGTESPRYTAATGSNFGTFTAVAPASEIGSPGNQGVIIPSISIGDASIAEGDAGTVVLSMPVVRNVSDTAFTVDYAVTGGSASAGVDYITLDAGTLSFTAGGTFEQSIDVTVNGDAITEPDETIVITLSNLVDSVGSTIIKNASGTGTIINDDAVAPSIAAQPGSTTIASGGVTTLRVRAEGLPQPTVQWYIGESGDISQPVIGATSATFITSVLAEDTHYWARVTNSAGSVDSDTVTVSVVAGVSSVDLSTYVRVGRYDLPEPTRTALPEGTPAHNLLTQEASGVAYNWDTDTLFIVCDGGRSITQVSKTGELIDTMTMALGASAQGTDFYDPEGITYIGDGEFVFAEERDRQLVRFTYAAGTTLSRADTKTVKIGTFVDNTGTEGLSYDPLTEGFICLKEISPLGIFHTTVDFDAGTASNGSATTENSVNLFDPSLAGMSDFADVFALSNLPAMSGQAQEGNLLLLGQEDARIVNIDRAGNILSTLNITSDLGNPLSIANQQHEGLTMDAAGNLYVVSENGGGDSDHPQLWVYAPATLENQAPTDVVLENTVYSILENSSTTFALKLADVVIVDDGLGSNEFTITGADAAYFEIDGFELFLKAGTVLDFESKESYTVTIEVVDSSLGGHPDVSTSYTLEVGDQVVELAPAPALIISEIAPWSSGDSPIGVDWFELTNTSGAAVDITGWKMDDGSGSFANAVALSGISSIAAGESVIFLETDDLPTTEALFLSTWFGDSAPAELQLGSYDGSGIGLSSNGDGVHLYDATGALQASVTFGASPATAPFSTFDNSQGIDAGDVELLSVAGYQGAFIAANDVNEIGSPGVAAAGQLVISEVAPWSSGNSPLGADWFEVTNIGARTVDITDWKMDDGSESPVAAVPLMGITGIAPGESVIFIELVTNLTDAKTAFVNLWFDGELPAGLQIGGYSGSGVGLSSGGDAVNLYDTNNVRRANVAFGASASGPYATFDNAAGLNVAIVSQLSSLGVNGAFQAANHADEIGSPGTIARIVSGAYHAWVEQYPELDLEDTGALVNGNVLPNLLLFAFGLDPDVNHTGVTLELGEGGLVQRGSEVLSLQEVGETLEFSICFLRRCDASQLGIRYIAEFSSDLVEWTAASSAPAVLDTDGEVEVVEVSSPIVDTDAQFARIRVVQN
ncbi:lamin tail domain-containing protein [Coraliomargarita algicola]|uniref:Lamin tail domain-containing protein n=1 Tax=Coraliomargarita algicola TaxID=3092156 RepID=A0ABZ0RNW7_9BACT|nr:lamin tail domain-containing protein [Coraliomargarita sp. J2-16]WPJ97916.1 lamin tail domain-containing protein [Coraliomargarita sp. J2-16]